MRWTDLKVAEKGGYDPRWPNSSGAETPEMMKCESGIPEYGISNRLNLFVTVTSEAEPVPLR
jgi:hypothetical protein